MARKDLPSTILDSAKELFYKHGFKRISIEDVCNKAEVSRRTFYVYYENKTDLLLQIIQQLRAENLQNIYAIANSELPFSEKLIQITNYNIEQVEKMTPEFLADLNDSSIPELKRYQDDCKIETDDITHRFFVTAQKNGDIRTDLDIAFLQRFMNYAIASYKNDEISKMHPDIGELLRKIANMLFYGILGKQK